MKFYISTTGIKRLTISSAGAGKGSPSMAATRRISVRTVLPLLLVLTLVLPFLFVRIAFIVLESATACSSTLGEADRGREGNCGFNTLASVLGSSGRKNMLKLRFRISLGGSMQRMDRSPRQQSLCDHRRENIVVIFSSDSASM